MVSDSDVTAAILIALLIIIFLTCVWPGYLWVRGPELAGFWATPAGGLYEIRPMSGRAFSVRASGTAGGAAPGTVVGLRGVRVAGRAGSVEIGGRRISWKGARETWSKQGIVGR